ncbi:carbohydrate ABC transporter permease [Brachybacterium sp. EE-P12]|uniref:carbohydrate ABC transporter permease n=1 Tax=Brachybacterium sp. EE-P12 TaxID=2306299 RepID=UPI001F14AFBB|nr:sugar ABC transporter permease [Brachybacterium sp. EE-P12]
MPYVWAILPAAAVATFYVYPFFNTVILSFTDAKPLGGGGAFVGLSNYLTVLADPDFHRAVVNCLVYAVVTVPLLVLLPLLLAVLVQKTVPGIGVFRSLFYVPAIASVVVVALAWSFLLKDNGSINELLMAIGVVDGPVPFLTQRWWLLASSMAVSVWKGLPYFMILYLSALANVDSSLHEAAEMDGAGAVRRFWTVTVPGVKVMMFLVGVLAAINAMKVFSEVFLLSNGSGGIGGRASTLAMYIREVGIADSTYGSLGQGSAASVLLFLLTIGLILASRRFNSQIEEQ